LLFNNTNIIIDALGLRCRGANLFNAGVNEMKSIKRLFLSLVYMVCMLGATFVYAETSTPININTASVEELQQIKGIGKTRAEAIVAYRDQHGPFEQVEDLVEVKGIGDATLARNHGMLIVD
jgi:competence protein ComEA